MNCVRHRPGSRFPGPDRFKAAEKSYSIKVSLLSVPDGSLGTSMRAPDGRSG